MGRRPLSNKQENFCVEYLKDFNASAAARRSGYSENSIKTIGSRLLSNPIIMERIEESRGKIRKKYEISNDKILKELSRIGHSDIGLLLDENGVIKPVSEWPMDIRKAVKAIEVEETFEYHEPGFYCTECGMKASKSIVGQVKKIALWGKEKGLELLGKHKKLWTEKIEHSGTVTLEDILYSSMEQKQIEDKKE